MSDTFIPGIYNYCDRWCARCNSTAHCRIFAQKRSVGASVMEISNKEFWDKVTANFEHAFKVLQNAAQKYGIELNNLLTEEDEATYNHKRQTRRLAAWDHGLSQLSRQYQEIGKTFLEKQHLFAEKSKEFVSHMQLGITSHEEGVANITRIADCFATINWYLYFIDSKLQRALIGSMYAEDRIPEKDYERDSKGSAKVALIAIVKSIEAWRTLYHHVPLSEDTALQCLSLLERQKEQLHRQFPDAAAFQRPGFETYQPA